MLKLEHFSDFYKKTVKSIVDRQDYKNLYCKVEVEPHNHDCFTHTFVIQLNLGPDVNLKNVLYLEAVVTRELPQNVKQWRIMDDSGTELDSDDNDDDIAHEYLSSINVSNNVILISQMVNGLRF